MRSCKHHLKLWKEGGIWGSGNPTDVGNTKTKGQDHTHETWSSVWLLGLVGYHEYSGYMGSREVIEEKNAEKV